MGDGEISRKGTKIGALELQRARSRATNHSPWDHAPLGPDHRPLDSRGQHPSYRHRNHGGEGPPSHKPSDLGRGQGRGGRQGTPGQAQSHR